METGVGEGSPEVWSVAGQGVVETAGAQEPEVGHPELPANVGMSAGTRSQGSYRPGRLSDTSAQPALSPAQLPGVKLGLSLLAPDMLARTTIAHLEAFPASFHIGVPLGPKWRRTESDIG